MQPAYKEFPVSPVLSVLPVLKVFLVPSGVVAMQLDPKVLKDLLGLLALLV